MSTKFENHLVKAVVDLAIFLEFTDDGLIDQDSAINAMEQLAAEMQMISKDDQDKLTQHIISIAASYEDLKIKQFIIELPNSLGLQ